MAAVGDILAGCAIAATVSIDVAALTTAKYAGKNWDLRAAVGWAALNSAWHGGLLAFYLLFISGIFSIFQGFASYLLTLLRRFDFELPFIDLMAILTTILEHFQTYGSVFLLFLVWFAYRGKVLSIPGEARIEDAPPGGAGSGDGWRN